MAYAFRVDPNIIHDVIQIEIQDKVKAKVKNFGEHN